MKWTVAGACCRSRRWSLWQKSLKVNPCWNTGGDSSWAEVAVLKALTARPSARAWRHCWSMTVNKTLPGVWSTETNHLHYTLGALRKKKKVSEDMWSAKQSCSWVAADQDPINHCLVLCKLPVIACWLMKLKHCDGTKAPCVLECTASSGCHSDWHSLHTWQMLTFHCQWENTRPGSH